jgi:hypothetical protein
MGEKLMSARARRKRHKSLEGIKEKDSNPSYSYEVKNFLIEESIEHVQRYFEFIGHLQRQDPGVESAKKKKE